MRENGRRGVGSVVGDILSLAIQAGIVFGAHAFLRASRTWCVSGLLGLLLSRASTCVNSVALSSGAFMALAGVQGGLIASRLHQGFAGVLLEACCSK